MLIYFEVPRYFPLKAYCYDTLNLVHSPGSSVGKESTCNAGDPGSIPGLGRSPGEGNGYPLQYSYMENPHGRRSLMGYIVRGVQSVAKSSVCTSKFEKHRPTGVG